MKKTTKEAVLRHFGRPLQIEEMPVPAVVAGRILVKVAACGVCHTDLHAICGDWPVLPTLPLIPGYEGVGTVVAVGEGVTQVKHGDRVGVPWLYTACGQCEDCLAGRETLCLKQQNTGYSVQGSFAEYVLADPNYVGRIPDALSFLEAAPILCAGLTVYKSLKETETHPDEWVVISGVGGLGHLAVQYAKAIGMRVAAVDIQEDKLERALTVGADLVFDASREDAVSAIEKQIGGAHGVLVTAPSRPAFEQELRMLRRHEKMVMVGLPAGDFDLNLFDVVSIVGTRLDLNESLAFAAQGKIKTHFHTESLDNVDRVMSDLTDGKIAGRMVLDMSL